MPVDPRDPASFPDEDETVTPSPETPEADAAEQRTDLRPDEDDPPPELDTATADEADAAEQARVVPLDEDDYR